MDSQKKNIHKPLTTNEIRAQAHNWNLAGDAGLLAHLEQFSQNVISKTEETQSSLNDLMNSFEETSMIISNVTNQFLALQNSQFVENRVYDDETPTEEKKPEVKEVDQEEQERLMLARYREAVEVGVKLLDTHFEQVQLPPSSDSDDEEILSGNPDLVWKPKNPYADKPFPLLIGSAEWWADDHVGLGEYEENVDSERVLSESDSEMDADRNIEKRVRMSSSSSTESETLSKKPRVPQSSSNYDLFMPPERDLFENSSSGLFGKNEGDLFSEPDLIFGRKSPSDQQVISPTGGDMDEDPFGVGGDRNSLFDEQEESENAASKNPSVAVESNKFRNAFTKELAAKLGTVANKQTNEADSKIQQSNENEVRPKNDKKTQGALLVESEEKEDDLFSTKNTSAVRKTDLFSNTENDDELFGGSSSLFSKSDDKGLFEDDLFSSSSKRSIKNPSPAVPEVKTLNKTAQDLFDGDLFADVDDSDTLFSSKPVQFNHPNPKISESADSSPAVKFSTPTEVQSKSSLFADDLFGSISAIRNNNNNESTMGESFNPLDAARLFDDELSKDMGFGEQTGGDSSNKSLAGAFQPQMSSTRRVSYETSDYKTQRISHDSEPLTRSNSSSAPLPQENSKNKMGHSEKAHFPRMQSKVFEDEDDDLFSSSSSFKPSQSKKANLFEDVTDQEDLFSSSTSKRTIPLPEKKSESSHLFGKSDAVLFEDDDSSLFVDTSKQNDAVSISSSRSSLFDDVSVGKSTLPSIFDKDKSAKNADDLLGALDNNLLSGKKVSAVIFEDTKDNLFSTGSSQGSKEGKNVKSLFGNVEDTDDLFGPAKKNSIFAADSEDGDLFGGGNVAKKHKEPLKRPELSSKTSMTSSNLIDEVNENENLFGEASIKAKSKTNIPQQENANVTDDLFSQVKKKIISQDPLASSIENSNEVQAEPQRSTVTKMDSTSKKKTADNLFGEPEDDGLFNTVEKPEIVESSASSITKEKLAPKIERDSLFDTKPEQPSSLKASNPLFDVGEEDALFSVRQASSGDKSISDSLLEDDLSKATEKPLDTRKNEEKAVTGVEDDVLFGAKPKPLEDALKTSENLFSSSMKPTTKAEASDLFRDPVQSVNLLATSKNIFSAVIDDKDLFGRKPEPPKSLNVKKTVNLIDNKGGSETSETDGGVISAVKPKKVGKLNIPTNLKINPTALLPGAKMKKDVIGEIAGAKAEESAREKVVAIDKPIATCNEPAEVSTNLLKCTSKDRVKIPARRRPQSRRARQEALRSSGIDFGVDQEEARGVVGRSRSFDDFSENSASAKTPYILPSNRTKTEAEDNVLVKNDSASGLGESSSSIFHSIENSPDALFSSPLPSNPLSPSTDEEDYFNVPELDLHFEKEDQSIFKSRLKSEEKNDDSLLFDGAPVLSPLDPSKSLVRSLESKKKEELVTNKKSGIFSDNSKMKSIFVDEDDDSLFGNTNSSDNKNAVSKKEEKPELEKKDAVDDDDYLNFFQSKTNKLPSGKRPATKSLFDDNGEEDADLFGKGAATSVPTNKFTKERVCKNAVVKPSAVEKTEEPFVDPLGLMSNPE